MITTTDQWKFPMRFRPGTSTWRVAEFESPDRPWLLAEFEHVEAVYKSFLLTSIDTLVATMKDMRLGRILRLNIALPPTASPTQAWSFVPVAKIGQELSAARRRVVLEDKAGHYWGGFTIVMLAPPRASDWVVLTEVSEARP